MGQPTLLSQIRCLYDKGRADFIKMGLGIEARYRRAKKFWTNHVELCKAFQAKSLEGYRQGGKVAICGAGPLIDINIPLVKGIFSEVALYDANPTLKRKWRREFSGLTVDCRVCDLTGALDKWTSDIKELLKAHPNEEKLTIFLSSLDADGLAPPLHADVVFSINLLSQLPIYWRDRVHMLLKRHLSLDTDNRGNFREPLQAALEQSMMQLQARHLDLLTRSGAKRIILISDLEFLYYRSDVAAWQPERALYVDLPRGINGYNVALMDGWFWHIAPQGIEEAQYGCFHDVRAYLFTAAPSAPGNG